MISLSRVRAVFLKEFRDFRRNRFVVVTMIVTPLLFLVLPIIEVFVVGSSGGTQAIDSRVGLAMLYLLITPVVVPTVIAAYSVVGEKEQGTLEPLLTTPLTSQELLLGKATAAWVPTLSMTYFIYSVFLICADLFAQTPVANAVFRGPILLSMFLFAPLLSGWSIWIGIAISTRASDVRVAQQLGTLASLPVLAVTSLITFGVLAPTFPLALELGGGLLFINLVALRLVTGMFNRERLITGRKATAKERNPRRGQLTDAATASSTQKGSPAMPANATLNLQRRLGGVLGRSVAWNIELDGEVIGSIEARQDLELPIPSGRHTLRLRYNRRISPTRTFEVGDGQDASFWCRGAMFWPQWVAATLKNDLWITLRRS
jgi:ABC-2 type transport system permease protein